jgi:hypothetical protein
MNLKLSIACLLSLVILGATASAQSNGDYLILQDIGSYKLDKPEKHLPGEPPSGGPRTYDSAGVVAGVGHFPDHTDKTFEVMYLGGGSIISPTVQVTKHAGSDSDKWLQHELDIEFRNYYGIPGYYIRTIDGNTVYVYGAGGRDYRWLSGNKVIKIEYHDSQLTKPEPIEVIQAYLMKHPSTLPAVTTKDVMSIANKTTWIKDEMDRRLWLCDKWFYQLQLGKVQQNQAFQETFKSMNIFLDYREKYFSIKAADEKNLLAGYLSSNNGSGIKEKLTEYKNWWSLNKNKAISL